jgi:Xaa-Pro aminopeptidase
MSEFPSVHMIDAGPALEAARLTKTQRELSLLRHAGSVNRAGHEELISQIQRAGKSERELWALVVLAMERRAERTLFVFGELVSGRRCRFVAYPGGPTDDVPLAGDLAMLDMSPRVNGYWSDATNTLVAGGAAPTRKQKLYGEAAREAFHAAANELRPGRPAHAAFDAAKAVSSKAGLEIGHHVGHQIGVTVNELPRLVPYERATIEAGMVFSVETGSYEGPRGEVGARMEKSVIVHDAGPEILCDFPWGF